MAGLIGGGDSHKSNLAKYGEDFDPTSWLFKGIGMDFLNPHEYIRPATDKLNEWIGTVAEPINKLNTKIEPGAAMLDKTQLGHDWNKTIENRPVDAIAMVLAAIFGGGAMAGAGGAGGAGSTLGSGAGTGTLGASGTAAGMSALTPSFASGIGATGASAITPAFGAGTSASMFNALTPMFGGYGAGMGGSSFLNNLSTADKIDYAKKLADVLRNSMDESQKKKQEYQNSMSPIGSYHNYHMPRSF